MFSSDKWFGSTPSFYNGVATKSVRFNQPSSSYLNKSVSDGTRTKSTFAWWMKRGQPSIGQYNIGEIFCFGGSGGGGSQSSGRITLEANKINISQEDSNSVTWQVITTQLLRDHSSWYHCVVVIDTTQSTDSDRVKVYINGNKVTSFSTASYPSEDSSTRFGLNGVNKVGVSEASGNPWSATYFDGYFADMYYLDGVVVSDSSSVISEFGEFKNGVWIPKEYTGSFGTNGFHFKFDQVGVGTASTSTIGADTSGNTNHYTSSGIVASDCAMPDSPENNFATWNSLRRSESASTFSEGNLKAVIPVSSSNSICATMGVSSGKYYWEVQRVSERSMMGVGDSTDVASVSGFPTGGNEFGYYADGGTKYPGGSSYGASFANGDIIGMALDMDAKTVVAYKNNVSQGTLASGLTDTIFPFVYNGSAQLTVIGNFGQDSSFAGTKTAQGNTDANGIGDFFYAPPSGFLALCTSNLPEPTISPNADTQADDYFNTVLYTGNSSNGHGITGVGFQPDWTWIKARSDTRTHVLYDSNRGAGKYLSSDSTNAEGTDTTAFASFDSDGFTVGTTENYINNSSHTYVAWNWKANGGTTTSFSESGDNPAGTFQANQTAGFSIVTTTGTGATGTISHGLGAIPKWIIAKQRNDANYFTVYHHSMGTGSEMYLALTQAKTNSNFWITDPTSSVFSVSSSDYVNENDSTYVFYCFAEVEGYSKFGSYTGNGNADGAFVFIGFRPAWLMVKVTNISGENWHIFDSERATFNTVKARLIADGSTAENSNDSILDFTSNGFKFRENNAGWNGNGNTYIYMAFAEAPFKYANAR